MSRNETYILIGAGVLVVWFIMKDKDKKKVEE